MTVQGMDPKPSESAQLSEMARRARGGDSEARNALWDAMHDTISAAVARQWALPRLWDRADLHQEAFLVFAEVCDAWPGGEFLPYFEKEYPNKLTNHVRRAIRKYARESTLPTEIEMGDDPDSLHLYRIAELLESLSRLPAATELALRLHLLWGLPLAEIGRQLGLGRRALGGLIPMAQRAAAGLVEGEVERQERLLRELYAFADTTGRIRATNKEVRRCLGLTEKEHSGFIAVLENSGVLRGRSRGHAGSLPADGPEFALRLLRRSRAQRTA